MPLNFQLNIYYGSVSGHFTHFCLCISMLMPKTYCLEYWNVIKNFEIEQCHHFDFFLFLFLKVFFLFCINFTHKIHNQFLNLKNILFQRTTTGHCHDNCKETLPTETTIVKYKYNRNKLKSEKCSMDGHTGNKEIFNKANLLNLDEIGQFLCPLCQDPSPSFTELHDKPLLKTQCKKKRLTLHSGFALYYTTPLREPGHQIPHKPLALNFRASIPCKNSQELWGSLCPASPHFSSRSSTPGLIIIKKC